MAAFVVAAIEIAPGGTLAPGRDGLFDGHLVQCLSPLDQAELGLCLDRPRGHQRVVTVAHLDVVEAKTKTEGHIVEGDAAAHQPEFLESAMDGASHVEPIAIPGPSEPIDSGAGGGNKSVDIAGRRCQIEAHHHRAKRPNIPDPGRLGQERGQIIVSYHQDRVLGRVARDDDRIGAGLVRLVGDAVEAGEVEDVLGGGGDDAVEPASYQGVEQPLQVAEARRQRLALATTTRVTDGYVHGLDGIRGLANLLLQSLQSRNLIANSLG